MTWTPTQAEAWMREHPGRWLESVSGALWCWTGLTFRRLLPGEGGSLGGWPRLPAEAGDFWPPREHWAAEAREKVWEIALRWRNAPLSLTLADDRKLAGKCLDDICALFRAAPEVDG